MKARLSSSKSDPGPPFAIMKSSSDNWKSGARKLNTEEVADGEEEEFSRDEVEGLLERKTGPLRSWSESGDFLLFLERGTSGSSSLMLPMRGLTESISGE